MLGGPGGPYERKRKLEEMMIIYRYNHDIYKVLEVQLEVPFGLRQGNGINKIMPRDNLSVPLMADSKNTKQKAAHSKPDSGIVFVVLATRRLTQGHLCTLEV